MKLFIKVTAMSLLTSVTLISQNDIDAMRYSQTTFGGTARSKAMAGSFGALGADGSCMGINPAGIGLYKKGDINFSVGLRSANTESNLNGSVNKNYKLAATFDGLTLVGAWDSKTNKDNHHALGLGCLQIANFANTIGIEGMAKKSITSDMLATAKNLSPAALDGSFAGMAYETFVLDTFAGKYYSFVDPSYTLKQTKTIETKGRINDWNINYAYGYKDKLYIGGSLGLPSVNYNYNSVYTEADVNDSMRIEKKNGVYSDTYHNYDVQYYEDSKTGIPQGGFKDLSYQESYKTTGSGTNLKIGAIYRATDFLRIGAAFHSPTFYSLTDTYIYKMSSSFDGGQTYTSQYPPESGGKYSYKIITPMKMIGSIAYLYKKLGAINVDYELVNYSQASLQSTNTDATFTDVNKAIRSKYSKSSNLKVGIEANLKPIFIRLGYANYGSAFGKTFSGDFVKSYYTGGIGFRQDKWYFDVAFTKSIQNENYYMYNPNYVDNTTLKNSGTTIAITLGSKF